jgi:aspartate aminotransferase
LRNCFLRYM